VGLAVLRQGEILALRHSDVDLASRVIHVRRSLQRSHRLLTLERSARRPRRNGWKWLISSRPMAVLPFRDGGIRFDLIASVGSRHGLPIG
jgi:hypothetical protein